MCSYYHQMIFFFLETWNKLFIKPFKEPLRDFDDDFMPENSDANICLLRRAAGDEHSISTLETRTVDSDSDNSEALDELGMDTTPCDYDDSPSSSADECGLLPIKPFSTKITETPSTNMTTPGGLHFRNNHFTRGSISPELLTSSSDEEGISTGLDFKNFSLDQTDASKSQINTVLAAVVKDSSECMGNWMEETQKRIDKEAANPTYQSDSSIDSEFEIIDND